MVTLLSCAQRTNLEQNEPLLSTNRTLLMIEAPIESTDLVRLTAIKVANLMDSINKTKNVYGVFTKTAVQEHQLYL